jgi:hypothetical protein
MRNRNVVWSYMQSTKSCAGPIDTKMPGTFYLNAEQVPVYRSADVSHLQNVTQHSPPLLLPTVVTKCTASSSSVLPLYCAVIMSL